MLKMKSASKKKKNERRRYGCLPRASLIVPELRSIKHMFSAEIGVEVRREAGLHYVVRAAGRTL